MATTTTLKKALGNVRNTTKVKATTAPPAKRTRKVRVSKPKATPAATPANAATDAKKPTASKFRGVTTGMRVMAFQDHTLAENHEAKLTDEQLADLWAKEFPQSACLARRDLNIVAGVRRLYNAGTHSRAQGNRPPETPSVAYDAKGNELPARRRGRRTEVAKEAQAA